MAEPALDPITEYQTDVMVLVAYLMHEGFTPQATDFDEDERRCYWVFLMTPTLLERVERYHAGQALVEPKNFSAAYYRISQERRKLLFPR